MAEPKIPKCAFSPLTKLLAEYGFNALKGDLLYKALYRKNDLYVGVSVSFHHRDYPFLCRVSLGEGSTEWPETDWNTIGLGWLVEAKAPDHYSEGTIPYRVETVEDVGPAILSVCDDLQRFCQDFLTGDLTLFQRVRAEITRERKPYCAHKPGPDAKYYTEIEPVSQALKERYSRSE